MPVSRIDIVKLALQALTLAGVIALGTFFYVVTATMIITQAEKADKRAEEAAASQTYLYGRVDELAANVAALRSETPQPAKINVQPAKVVVVLAPTGTPRPTQTPESTPKPGGLIPFFLPE